MTLSQFRTMPLLRSFISVDPETSHMLRTEVRRDPASGLTLSLTFKTT